jgi:hypothetical protein
MRTAAPRGPGQGPIPTTVCQVLRGDMNPGFNLALKVPFDVPTGTVRAAIELHDSVFSNGARVQVN